MASRWFRRRLSESLRDWDRRLVSTLPSGQGRFNAARSRSALKSSSLSLELSLDRLKAARLRWAARRSSLCSLDSLDRSKAARLRLAVRRSSLCSLVSLDRLTATPWRFLSSLPFVACPSRWSFKTFSRSPPNWRDPLSDMFSSNTSCSLSFDICLNVDDFSRHFCALTQKSHQCRIPMTSVLRATNKLRESSALPATMLRTSPSPSRWRHDSVPQTNSARAQPSPPPCSAPVPLHPDDVTTPCHKQTQESSTLPATMLRTSPSPSRWRHDSVPQTNSARAQPSPPPCSAPVPLHPDDVTTPCHKQTPRELSAPRHHAPQQSLSIPMTSRICATNKLRESSALPATMLRTSPSPSRWRHDSVPQTNSRELNPPRHHAPHQSLSIPMTSRLRATNKLRESSTLPATMLRTSPSPSRWRHDSVPQTNSRELNPPRHHAPHQSLSIPMTSRLRATNKLRESSALPATMLRTSPSPSRWRHDSVPQTNSARAQPSPPPCSATVPLHPDDVTTPCHKQTPRELSAPRHHAPQQSLSIPMTSRICATNKLRESSALPATMLRTSPSPSRWRHDSVPQTNSARGQPSPPPCSATVPLHPDDVTTPCHKQTPLTRVPNISPLTRGKNHEWKQT